MDEENRSLAWTLAAAVATYALLVITSWKMGLKYGSYTSSDDLVGRVLWHAINTFLMPYETVHRVINQAMSLLLVRSSYLGKGMPFFPHLEAAMTHLSLSSTLHLEAPASQDPGPHLRRFLVSADSIAALRPVDLSPIYVAGLFGDTDRDAADLPPPDEEKLYLCLPAPIFFDDESMQEREALLMCGFAALHQVEELGTMDEKRRLSGVWVWTVALQAGGYALGVAERWKRGVGVSPVEVLVCVFSVPMLIQLLLLPPAARLSYDRPLLLRLRALQFSLFREMPRQLDRANAYKGNISKLILYFAYMTCSYCMLPTLTTYYSLHYWHTRGLVCSLSTLLLLLLFIYPFFAPTLASLMASKYNLDQDTFTRALLLLGLWQMCMVISSITLAFFSTITHWDSFDSPINPQFAWLLPHLAT
ncbi:hypothetical protein L7F22_046727 [Adiantum nelumboides]|nr:hypothetical protein [Adiantum nelumboides]